MNSWPSTLQDKVNAAGFRNQFGSSKIRSTVDVGPAKVRSRFTTRIDQYSSTINLTLGEYDTFKNFYDTTLNNGVETFLFLDPLTDTEKTFRFVGDPSISHIGGNEFIVQMTWELLG